MIVLDGLTKSFRVGGGAPVFDGLDAVLPSDGRFALLGVEQSGKSLLLRLLAGVDEPSAGTIVRHARLSFPVGYSRALKPNLSARQNVVHAARLYDADAEEVSDFVLAATEFGPLYDEPVRKLQPHERSMLAYALGYAIPFDTYLVDENVGVGAPAFRRRCEAMFAGRAEHAGVILATRHPRKARELCTSGGVIVQSRLVLFDRIEDAVGALQDEQIRLAALAVEEAARHAPAEDAPAAAA